MLTENSKRFVFQKLWFVNLSQSCAENDTDLGSRRSLNLAGEISKLRPKPTRYTRHNPLISMIQVIHRPFHQLFRWQMISRDTCCFYRDVSVMYSKFTDENRTRTETHEDLNFTEIISEKTIIIFRKLIYYFFFYIPSKSTLFRKIWTLQHYFIHDISIIIMIINHKLHRDVFISFSHGLQHS